MPRMLATRIAAQAVSNANSAAELRIWTPRASVEPPKYSPTTAPIIARTLATFNAEKRYGSELGSRTRRKISSSPAAYERMSSIDDGRTDVSPRSVLTKTGKKQRTAAIAILESGFSRPNHWFVIGAKAMIGIAFAAIAYGITAERRVRKRARRGATSTAAEQPIANPPSASLNVYQPAFQSTSRSSQNVSTMLLGGGRRKRWTSRAATIPSHRPIPSTNTARAGSHSRAPRIVRPSSRSPATGATAYPLIPPPRGAAPARGRNRREAPRAPGSRARRNGDARASRRSAAGAGRCGPSQ